MRQESAVSGKARSSGFLTLTIYSDFLIPGRMDMNTGKHERKEIDQLLPTGKEKIQSWEQFTFILTEMDSVCKFKVSDYSIQ